MSDQLEQKVKNLETVVVALKRRVAALENELHPQNTKSAYDLSRLPKRKP